MGLAESYICIDLGSLNYFSILQEKVGRGTQLLVKRVNGYSEGEQILSSSMFWDFEDSSFSIKNILVAMVIRTSGYSGF